MKKNILLVEDDETLGAVLKDRLLIDYHVDWVTTQSAALKKINSFQYDLAILDIGLPDGNGFNIAQQIKGTKAPLFIFLTAQNDPESRLAGYELGAEEFIPKPFHLKELLIRVRHVLDQHAVIQNIEIETCMIDLQNYSVHHNSGRIEYPPVKDMQVLKFLIDESPKVLSRDEIINHVWGAEKDLSPRSIDNAIARLRQTISDQDEKRIRSVRGIGYQWSKNGGPQ